MDNNICYIGSTFNQLKQRWQGHKTKFKRWLKNKDVIGGRCSIFKYYEKYGIENFTIIKIKEYLVYRENNKDSRCLLAYEQLWINRTKCINNNMAFSILRKLQNKINTAKSYQDNKEYQDNKGFTKQSKEERLIKRRTIINCDCGGKYQVNNKWSHIKTDKHKNNLNISKKETI